MTVKNIVRLKVSAIALNTIALCLFAAWIALRYVAHDLSHAEAVSDLAMAVLLLGLFVDNAHLRAQLGAA